MPADPVRRTLWLLPGEESLGILAMLVIGVLSTVAAHGAAATVATAAALSVAEIGLLVFRHVPEDRSSVRAAGLLVAVVTSLLALLTAPDGLAEVPVLVASSRLPRALPPRASRLAVIASAVAFGVIVAVISGNVAGLLAGIGVWLLAQRTVVNATLEAERDRAVGLVAELEAARGAEAEAAAAEERARIAREMHDVLAHSLAGLSLQLQAVRAVAVREGVGPAVTGPLDTAAQLARDGVAEARAAVGALRGPGGPGLAAVGEMVERFPGTAQLRTTGEALTVGDEAEHAVYRGIQESLTNAARYAPGAPVEVVLGWTAARLVVTVANGPPRRRPEPVTASTGQGLAGMRERLGRVGGAVDAGPRDGGWQVRLEVPAVAP